MDRSAWRQGSCRSRRWRYVYVAFAGTCLDGKDGRSGAGCAVHRTRREAKGAWIRADSDAIGIIDGTGLWNPCSAVCQSAGRIFPVGECGNTESRVGLHQNCVRIHRFFVFVRNVNRNIYGTGRFQDAVCRKSFWFSGEYDSGSGFDSGTGTISEIWGCRSSDGDCFGSGNC